MKSVKLISMIALVIHCGPEQIHKTSKIDIVLPKSVTDYCAIDTKNQKNSQAIISIAHTIDKLSPNSDFHEEIYNKSDSIAKPFIKAAIACINSCKYYSSKANKCDNLSEYIARVKENIETSANDDKDTLNAIVYTALNNNSSITEQQAQATINKILLMLGCKGKVSIPDKNKSYGNWLGINIKEWWNHGKPLLNIRSGKDYVYAAMLFAVASTLGFIIDYSFFNRFYFLQISYILQQTILTNSAGSTKSIENCSSYFYSWALELLLKILPNKSIIA